MSVLDVERLTLKHTLVLVKDWVNIFHTVSVIKYQSAIYMYAWENHTTFSCVKMNVSVSAELFM